jgi:hypothetical protein
MNQIPLCDGGNMVNETEDEESVAAGKDINLVVTEAV